MKRFSTAQRVFIIATIYKNTENFEPFFNRNEALCKSTLCRLITSLQTTGSVLILKSLTRKLFRQTEVQLVLVLVSVTVGPAKSHSRRSMQLDIATFLLHSSFS